MLIYGGGKQAKQIGVTADQIKCPQCGGIGNWAIYQTNKKAHVYFVPVAKWDKKWFAVCPRCDAGVQLDDRDQADRLIYGVPTAYTGTGGKTAISGG